MEIEAAALPPAELKGAARAEWERVVAELKAQDLLTSLDRAALAAYCGAYALWAEAMEAIQKYGSVVKTKEKGFPVQSPYVGIASKQASVMMRIAGDFGFTPATRDRRPMPGRNARYDLFGDPVPENFGGRGRPEHISTQSNRNKVTLLLALGWSNERIARAINISAPTLRRAYRKELRVRAEARDRLDASLFARCYAEAMKGNVGAMKEFARMLERSDLMHVDFARPKAGADDVADRLGKKEQAQLDAERAHRTSQWGALVDPPVARPN